MPCSKPTPSPLSLIVESITEPPLPLRPTPSPLYCWPSLPLPLTVDALSVSADRLGHLHQPRARVADEARVVIVTAVPALTCTPVPALLVTVTPSRTTRAALSIQTACGAAASTVSPRSMMSWTPTSMTLTAPGGRRDRDGAVGLVDDRRGRRARRGRPELRRVGRGGDVDDIAGRARRAAGASEHQGVAALPATTALAGVGAARRGPG